MMADVDGQKIAKVRKTKPKTMLFIGRITMTVATGAGRSLASGQLTILDLLVFVGASLSVHCGAPWCSPALPVLLGKDHP
ncbi:MAG: hypothetical protein ABI563_08930 [Specibacter sp.]